MPQLDVTIRTADGECPAVLLRPDGDEPWPGVVMYPDAGSLRPVFVTMGERLAGLGYVVLVPDIYYRSGEYEPFDVATAFSDPEERRRLGAFMGELTAERSRADASAFVDHLASRVEVVDGPVGTTGYCMGGRISLDVAGHLGERIGAAASFHGGRLAVEDDPDSPHRSAHGVTASVYVGAAKDDGSFGPDQLERLTRAYADAGVDATIEVYDALHGFAVPDNRPSTMPRPSGTGRRPRRCSRVRCGGDRPSGECSSGAPVRSTSHASQASAACTPAMRCLRSMKAPPMAAAPRGSAIASGDSGITGSGPDERNGPVTS